MGSSSYPRSSYQRSTVYTFMSSVIHMAFLKAFVGIPPPGKAKIRQVNLLDACKALLNVLYINFCIFHILCISIAIGLGELSAIKIPTIPLR